MIKKVLLYCLLFASVFSFSQEIKYKEYSYTELFSMIEKEKDSVFELKDAIIKINPETDERFIITQEELQGLISGNEKFKEFEVSKRINKTIALNNVQFQLYDVINDKPTVAIIQNIEFLKPVTLINVSDVLFKNIKFNHKVKVSYTSNYKLIDNYNKIRFDHISLFYNCLFGNGLYLIKLLDNIKAQYGIKSSIIKSNGNIDNKNKIFPTILDLGLNDLFYVDFSNNYVEDYGASRFDIRNVDNFSFSNNTFENSVRLFIKSGRETKIINNHFKEQLFLDIEDLNTELTLDYKQFTNNLFSSNFNNYFFMT